MMSRWQQLLLLLWKNSKLKFRSPLILAAEILVPVFYACSLVLQRLEITPFVHSTASLYGAVSPGFPQDMDEGTYRWRFVGFSYVPSSPVTDRLARIIEDSFDMKESGMLPPEITGFSTEEEAFSHLGSSPYKYIVIFEGDEWSNETKQLPKQLKFKIRYEHAAKRTGLTYPRFLPSRPPCVSETRMKDTPKYVINAQYQVAQAFVRYWVEELGGDPTPVKFDITTVCMPHPPNKYDDLITVLKGGLPLYVQRSLLVFVAMFTKRIIAEKESRLKETMKLMNLDLRVYWLSWLVTFSTYYLPVIALYAHLLCVVKNEDGFPVLTNIEPSVLFAFMSCYGLAIIAYCLLVSSLVQSATAGAIISAAMLLFLPSHWFKINESKITKLFSCLHFNAALKYGISFILLAQYNDKRLTWSNMHLPPDPGQDSSLLECMLMLLLDSVIYSAVAWYIDHVYPGKYGVAKPLCFCFQRASRKPIENYDKPVENLEVANTRLFEPVPGHLKPGISMRNLRKVFGTKVAVKNTTLDVYEDQITVLLGHNGAGKTATLDMLTGFTPPTSGTVYINGYDIRTNMQDIRSDMSFCPLSRHDLFDWLTVREHLLFFSELKGHKDRNSRNDVLRCAEQIGLRPHLDSYASWLSGGERRKLAVTIALIGHSKVIILDEPTTGMDPTSRRDTWDALKRAKRGSTVLLTTHLMEEAEALGDRIAFMVDGAVQCCGSARFLKTLYGTGFRLIMELQPQCDIPSLLNAVKEHVQGAELNKTSLNDALIILPKKDASIFPQLFQALDNQKDWLKIRRFGISTTSMEDVYLSIITDPNKIAEIAHTGEGHGMPGASNMPSSSAVDSLPKSFVPKTQKSENSELRGQVSSAVYYQSSPPESSPSKHLVRKKAGLQHFRGTVWTLLVKRFIFMKRKPLLISLQLLIPVFIKYFVLRSDDVELELAPVKPVTYDLSGFTKAWVLYSPGLLTHEEGQLLASVYAQQFRGMKHVQLVPIHMDLREEAIMKDHYLDFMSKHGVNTRLYMPIGMEVVKSDDRFSARAIAYFHGYPLHSREISVNYLMNALVQFTLNESFGIQTSAQGFSFLRVETAEGTFVLSFTPQNNGIYLGVYMAFGMAFMNGLTVYFLIHERQMGAKTVQLVSGTKTLAFWLSTFLADFLVHLVGSSLIMAALVLPYSAPFVEKWYLLLLSLICYGWASIGFVYVFQFMFTTPALGKGLYIILNVLTGPQVILSTFVSGYKDSVHSASWREYVDKLDFWGPIFSPLYSASICIKNIYTNYYNLWQCELDGFCGNPKSLCCKDNCTFAFCLDWEKDYLSWDSIGIGRYLFAMLLQGLVLSALVTLIDMNIFERLWYFYAQLWRCCHSTQKFDFNTEDSDVAAERLKILNRQPEHYDKNDKDCDQVTLVKLSKSDRCRMVVDDLCLGVSRGQCFGLLGEHGAGKTKILQVLTGERLVTSGKAFVLGRDVVKTFGKHYTDIGYCPQDHGLIPEMTARETLTMYARVKGLPDDVIPERVHEIMKQLLFDDQPDTVADVYRDGTKRKLSTAIALLGSPPVILLDEPFLGMDPKARLRVREALERRCCGGQTILMTSNNIEESERLCTRIAILANGRMLCLGSPQDLKSRFGHHHTFIVHLTEGRHDYLTANQPVINYIKEKIEGAELFEERANHLHFKAPERPGQLAAIFTVLERGKSHLPIQDYSVQQTFLEEVFLELTRQQTPPTYAGLWGWLYNDLLTEKWKHRLLRLDRWRSRLITF